MPGTGIEAGSSGLLSQRSTTLQQAQLQDSTTLTVTQLYEDVVFLVLDTCKTLNVLVIIVTVKLV